VKGWRSFVFGHWVKWSKLRINRWQHQYNKLYTSRLYPRVLYKEGDSVLSQYFASLGLFSDEVRSIDILLI
jgi:hypothetical protein